jgi:hypothetical protein
MPNHFKGKMYCRCSAPSLHLGIFIFRQHFQRRKTRYKYTYIYSSSFFERFLQGWIRNFAIRNLGEIFFLTLHTLCYSIEHIKLQLLFFSKLYTNFATIFWQNFAKCMRNFVSTLVYSYRFHDPRISLYKYLTSKIALASVLHG